VQRYPAAQSFGRSGSVLLINPTDRLAPNLYAVAPAGSYPGMSGRQRTLRNPRVIRQVPPVVVTLPTQP
jgi:hypothetical protein